MKGFEIRAGIGRFFLKMAGKLPLGFLYGIGRVGAWFLEYVMNYRKDVIYTNLARSFPEKKCRAIRSIAKDYYKRMGDLFAETIWFGGCPGNGKKLRKQKIYEYTNPELLMEMHAKGGIMAMKSHCGNWELLGGMHNYTDYPGFVEQVRKDQVFVAYKTLRNKAADKIFYENRRAPLPDYPGLIDDKSLMRHAVMNRKKNPIYILNTDQRPYKGKHFVGTFLNQPTNGIIGGFALAAKLGFAVLYMREERAGRGHYLMTFEVITENAEGQDPEQLMRKYYELLEADIRKDPANWLWSHRRWG